MGPMPLSKIIRGMQILSAYFDSEVFPEAYRDCIFVQHTAKPLTSEDFEELNRLGWYQPDSDSGTYNPEDGWRAECLGG